MNSITYVTGHRSYFENYADFAKVKDIFVEAELSWVSYYDAKGDTHICQYRRTKGGVEVGGLLRPVADVQDLDRWEICNIAGDIVKEELRTDEFVGWSI